MATNPIHIKECCYGKLGRFKLKAVEKLGYAWIDTWFMENVKLRWVQAWAWTAHLK